MSNPVSRYGFLNAKLRARLSKQEEENLAEKLLKTSSFIEAMHEIKNSRFAELADVYEKTGDVELVEKMLVEDQIARHKEINNYLESVPKEVAEILLEKVEVDNLKNILRLWAESNLRHEDIGYRLNYIIKNKIVNDIPWNHLINASTWNSIQLALSGTIYEELFNSYPLETIATEGLMFLEMDLDNLFYSRLLTKVKKLDKYDRKISLEIYESDLDLKNILILIRYGWLYDMDKKNLRRIMIRGGHLYDNPIVEEYLKTRNPMILITKFHELSDKLQNRFDTKNHNEIIKECLIIENYLAKERKRQYKKMLRGYPFCIGIVLAYFFIYESGIKRIRVILNGKHYGWSEEQIMGVIG